MDDLLIKLFEDGFKAAEKQWKKNCRHLLRTDHYAKETRTVMTSDFMADHVICSGCGGEYFGV